MNQRIPTDRELEALKILWNRGRATVREICDELRRAENQSATEVGWVKAANDSPSQEAPPAEDPPAPPLAYTTVLSLMQAMEQKGLVGHEEIGRAYSYFARVERDSTFRRLAGGFLDRVFDGAMDQYLVHGLKSRRPTIEELEQLEQMIAEAKVRSRQAEEKGRKQP